MIETALRRKRGRCREHPSRCQARIHRSTLESRSPRLKINSIASRRQVGRTMASASGRVSVSEWQSHFFKNVVVARVAARFFSKDESLVSATPLSCCT